MKGGKITKIRVFEEDKLLRTGGNVKVYYAMALYDMGLGVAPKLQLSAVGKKSKLVKGDINQLGILGELEHGLVQMQMLAAARRRIENAAPHEIAAFRKGSFIQIEGVTR